MDSDYTNLTRQAQEDENILGLFLGGSRSRGVETEHSDWDAYMIIKDSVVDEYKQKFANHSISPKVYPLSEFQQLAEYGSGQEWARYGFSYVKVDVDKLDGQIQKLVSSKSSLPADVAEQIVINAGNKYINLVYRSIKNHRAGQFFASHLDANESIPNFLEAIFAVEKRLRPYNKYLEWELKNHPLKVIKADSSSLLKILRSIIETGDIKMQKQLFQLAKEVYAGLGSNNILDGQWQKQQRIIEEYEPRPH